MRIVPDKADALAALCKGAVKRQAVCLVALPEYFAGQIQAERECIFGCHVAEKVERSAVCSAYFHERADLPLPQKRKKLGYFPLYLHGWMSPLVQDVAKSKSPPKSWILPRFFISLMQSRIGR